MKVVRYAYGFVLGLLSEYLYRVGFNPIAFGIIIAVILFIIIDLIGKNER